MEHNKKLSAIADDILAVISKVIARQVGGYNVLGYDREDLEQEAFIICAEALPSHDGIRPLENFLAVHLSYRLKSFVRDKHKLQGKYAETTQKLMKAVDIDSVNWDAERSLTARDDVLEDVELRDLIKTIDRYLPISLRQDYLKMRAGIKINRGREKKIREFIGALLEELN